MMSPKYRNYHITQKRDGILFESHYAYKGNHWA